MAAVSKMCAFVKNVRLVCIPAEINSAGMHEETGNGTNKHITDLGVPLPLR